MVLADYGALEQARLSLKNPPSRKEWARVNKVNYNTYRRSVNDAAKLNGKPSRNGNGHKAEKAEVSMVPDHEKPLPPHRLTALRRFTRACVVDIETSDFDAVGYKGILLCACFLPLDSDTVTTVRMQMSDHLLDRRVLVELFREMWKYDILIWQNGAAFDGNWFNTKRIYHGMPNLRTWLYFDTYQAAKSVALASGGKSLGNLIDFYGLSAEKTAIRKTSWSHVYSHDELENDIIMAKIIYHCEQDVFGQRELYDAVMPDALTLTNNPYKLTKWRTGIPDFEAWEAEWSRSSAALKVLRESAA